MDRPADWKQSLSRQELRELLAERYACFVLISCGEPTPEGKIEVEMTYEGDDALAAYLIESAQNFIEEPQNDLS
jgi:hypothetical protein